MPANLTIDTAPPSAVFLYSPHSCDNLKPPLSPTSSIKGCFVRSRPTSTDFAYEYSQLPNFAMEPTVSSVGSDITTPTSSVTDELLEHASHATEQWALTQMKSKDSDARSLAPSTLTCTDRRPVVPVRIIRRSDAEMDKELVKMAKEQKQLKDQNAAADGANTIRARRRTWPSYKAIRKTVSNILHRKDAPVVTDTEGAKGEFPSPGPTPERVKSSSASMFTKRRRATVSDSEKKTEAKVQSPIMHRASSSRGSSMLQHRAQLRRSRSFSGFTNVLTVIDDAADDDDLDELTTEARGVVLDIRRRWDFEEVPEDAALMFERCIE